MIQEREETLGEFLAEHAREASDGRLAWQAAGAVLTAVAIVVWRGPAWDIRFAIATTLLAFAVWGVADRDMLRTRWATARVPLRAVRVIAGVIGFAAGAYVLMALLARALGRIIS